MDSFAAHSAVSKFDQKSEPYDLCTPFLLTNCFEGSVRRMLAPVFKMESR